MPPLVLADDIGMPRCVGIRGPSPRRRAGSAEGEALPAAGPPRLQGQQRAETRQAGRSGQQDGPTRFPSPDPEVSLRLETRSLVEIKCYNGVW